jgi:hypothetical protein
MMYDLCATEARSAIRNRETCASIGDECATLGVRGERLAQGFAYHTPGTSRLRVSLMYAA